MPVFARLWPVRVRVRVRVRVSFSAGAVRSAILATAGLLVNCDVRTIWRSGLSVRATVLATFVH